MPELQKMYANRPRESLNGYEDSQEIRAPLDPRFLEDQRYKIKDSFLYFPNQNTAIAFSALDRYPSWVSVTKDAGGQLLAIEAKGKKFYSMYWFAIQAYRPTATILK